MSRGVSEQRAGKSGQPGNGMYTLCCKEGKLLWREKTARRFHKVLRGLKPVVKLYREREHQKG